MLRKLLKAVVSGAPARANNFTRRAVAEACEARVLYSADLNPMLWAAGDANAEVRVLDASSPSGVASAATVTQSQHEIIFVDAGVPDAQTLIDAVLAARGANAGIEIVRLNAESDGLEQISKVLAGEQGLDAIHIISHGDAGRLQLGSSLVDAQALTDHANGFAAWRAALTADADLLLYGCDVAAGGAGQAFMQALAQATGADVAASTDATGSVALGGNWVLEAATGHIEAHLDALARQLEHSWNGLLTLNPQGSETRVNTSTSGTQSTTAYGGGNVAMDSAGNYVVVFNDNFTTTGDIYFQRYNAAGVAQGSNTLANTTTSSVQDGAQVAMDSSGNFVVTWVSASQDGSGYGIYAQRFNASGVAQGSEFRANTATLGNQTDPTVAMSSGGAFMIAWTDSQTNDVSAQRYNASGVAQGGQFRVNATASSGAGYASSAMDGSGNFVIAWESAQAGNLNIYGQRYNASGAAQGGEFLVNATTAGAQSNTAVAIDSSGNFVVVWDAATQDAGTAGVYAQRFNASGVAQGSEFRVNTTSTDNQEVPAVAMNAAGGFVVTWKSNLQDGSGWGVYAQEYNASGVAQGGETRVATTTTSDQVDPSVAYIGSKAVVAWKGNGPGDSSGVFMQRYSIGAPVGITVTPPVGLLTTEAGGTAAFSVVLDSAPTGNVTIPVSSSDLTEGTVSTASLVFTAANWATPQTVIVTGVDDALADGFVGYTAVLGTASSSDAGYNGLNPNDVQLANADNDTAYNAITVNTTNDTADGDTSSLAALASDRGADGLVSLREAITAANNTANGGFGADRIWFSVGGGIQTFSVGATALPTITDAVLIDGWTSSGFSTTPVLQLNGNNAGAGNHGFSLGTGSSGSTIRGFIINRFTGDGVHIDNSNSQTIEGNWIGVNSAGSAASANAYEGIYVANSSGNLIGGIGDFARNVISGNGERGIYFSSVSNSVISGNYIGTDVTGTLDLNGSALNLNQSGVVLANNSNGNLIGGSALGARNVISGNNHFGFEFQTGSQNNAVQGNYIGTTASGATALGNYSGGVSFWGSGTGNVVGGGTASERNVISGNRGVGVWVSNASPHSVIQGNYIGVNASGDAAVGNGQNGILVDGASTATLVERNVVSGNTGAGISITDAGTDFSVLRGNYVGTNAAGNAALGNSLNGVDLVGGANTVVGGTGAGEGNVLSGNGDDGLLISNSGTDSNVVFGNVIGLNAAQTAALGNANQGIWIGNGAKSNLIGGAAAGAANVVAGNTFAGIELSGAGTAGNIVSGNIVGTNAAGTFTAGNGSGIYVQLGAQNNTIGGTAAGAGNLIVGNIGRGVVVTDAASTGNALLGNRISGNGSLAIDLGFFDGVTPNDLGDADIGPNNLQNTPVVISARTNGAGSLFLTGSLNSTPNSQFRVEVFANSTQDASGHGEGQRYLGFVNFTTDGSGNASGPITLSSTVAVGEFISATATQSNAGFTAYSSTSEFSKNAAVVSSTQALITVDTTSDASDGDTSSISTLLADKGADGKVSLREAIIAANNTANGSAAADRIQFNIADALVGGEHTISVATELPFITDALQIDGSTEPDFLGAPVVRIDGASTYNISGLTLDAGSSGSSIRGISVTGFLGNGMPAGHGVLVYSNNNVIAGNYLGLRNDGMAAGNWIAVAVFGGATGNLIGGTTATDRNVVSGNTAGGVAIGAAGTNGNVVAGNYFGVAADGITARPNTDFGVNIWGGASQNLVGGITVGSGNLIRNSGQGIRVDGTAVNNALLGNSIYGNPEPGIDLNVDGVTLNDAGDADTGPNNLQNFPVLATARTNASNQISLTGSFNSSASSYYRIEFFSNISQDATNYGEGQTYLGFVNVATNGSGNASISTTLTANVAVGAFISATATKSNAAYNTFTDTSEFARNIATVDSTQAVVTVDTSSDIDDGDTTSISALLANKGADGFISLREAITAANNTANGSSPDRILFGISGTGIHTIALSSLLPQIVDTVVLDASTDDSFAAQGNRPAVVLDGGNTVLDGLVLAPGSDGSTVRGLVIQRFTQDGIDITTSNGNTIVGNWLGLNSAGTGAAGNQQGLNIYNSNATVVGGTTVADRNVMSGNTGQGIYLAGTTTGTLIRGNYIGTNASGSAAVANTVAGIYAPAGGNTVGGTAAGSGNLISGNGSVGIAFIGAIASGNFVQGNWIGLNSSGTGLIGNGNDGVYIVNGASNNTIGGATTAHRNVISGNSDGVQIGGTSGSNSNLVQGNYIGTDSTGTVDLGNADDGVDIDNGALNNQVIGNLIAGNASDGIDLGDAGASTGTVIRGNLIGTAADGSSALGNSGHGILVGNGGTANSTVIGGTAGGQANTIAFNGGDGVFIPASTAVTILGNSIHSNTGLALDLGTNGVTANDTGDADAGANNLQNFPVLVTARTNASSQLILTGSLNSSANSYYRIEFFASTSQDSTGYGEGQIYLGFANVATDGSGNASISTTLAVNVVAGSFISATATKSDAAYNTFTDTSEFAQNVLASVASLVGTSGGNLAYTENASATAIDSGLTVTDADPTPLNSATVSISSNFALGEDVLAFTSQNGITGVWNAATGVLALSGSSSVANYQTALRSVTYFNSSDNPSTLTRTVSFKVNDGQSDSNSATHNIDVTAVNDPPVIGNDGGTLSYTENDAASVVSSGLTLSDADSANLSSATISVSTGFVSGEDVLAFTNQNGITGSWNAGTGVLTLSGNSSVANYQTALRSVTYANASDNPSTATRTVSFAVNDGAANSNQGTRNISVTAVNDVPVNTLPSGLTINEDGTLALAGISIADADAGSSLLRTRLTVAQGTLAAVGSGGVTVTGSGTASITLVGTLANLNAYFAGASPPSFTGAANAYGTVQLAMVTSDGLNTGTGGTVAAGTLDYRFQDGTPAGSNPDNVSPVGGVTGVATDFNVTALATALSGSSASFGVIYTGIVNVTTAGTYTFTVAADDAAKLYIDGTQVVFAFFSAGTSNTVNLSAGQHSFELRYAQDVGGATLSAFYSGPDTSAVPTQLFSASAIGRLVSQTATTNITVTAVNDAPVLAPASPNLTSITEDDLNNPGQTVSSFIGSTITDVDGDATGIAIRGANNGNGTWQFSTDNGSSWSSLGVVSDSAALLLRGTDLLRLVPNGNQGTTATLDYRAWDRSSGTAGVKVDATANGGSTAFSTAVNTATIVVSDVNDAPIITSFGGGATVSVAMAENLSAVTTVTSTDVDSTPLNYSISGGADAARFAINSSTGVLSFIAPPDFETPTDADFNNIYDVTVQVSDGLLTDTQAFNITVTDVSSALIVTTTADTNDTGLGSSFTAEQLNASKGADGAVSLREAIMAANNTVNGPGGADRIEFNIADPLVAGAHLIELAVALPNITDAVIIDGSTEPDSVAGAPVIQIDGALVYNVDGLSLQAGSDGSTLRGLSVTGFFSNGTPAGHAITVASNNNVIAGNYVGLSPNGNAVGNWAGVVLVNSTNNLVGGLTPSERNVISANTLGAVGLFGASGNRVQGNYIGVAPNGISARPNYDGVRLLNGSSNNLIGGTAPGAGNLIAYSAGSGVMASSSTSLGNAVLGNRVFGSTGLGIDLGADGVSANDAGDADSGPNGLQNFPLLATANATSGNTTVVGSLNSNASSSYRIEFFSSSNGSLEGAYVYLGFTDVVTDSFGNANFSVVLSGVTVAANDMVISTATLKSGAAFIETSEFSEDVLATNNAPGVSVSAISGSTNESGGSATFNVVLNTAPAADVTISITSSKLTEGTVSTSLLTFTSLNWSVAQTVTVTGADDSVLDGTVTYSIVTGATTSADASYSGLNVADVSVNNFDNEASGILVSAPRVGNQFTVNTGVTGAQQIASNSSVANAVAMNAAGGSVVVWTDYSGNADGNGPAVLGQRFNADGSRAGNEFLINSTVASAQRNAVVAMAADGRFVVSWESLNQDAAGTYGIYAQRYNADGSRLGGEMLVNQTTAGDQRNPTIAIDASGNFVVVWEGDDGAGSGIFGRRFNWTGATLGNEFLVNTQTSGTQRFAVVGADSAGNFTVSWTGASATDSVGVMAQRYNSAGVAQGGNFQVNQTTAGNQEFSRLAYDAAGNLIITWRDDSLAGPGSTLDIYFRRYDATGAAVGGQTLVTSALIYGTADQAYPVVAADAAGNFVIAWDEDGGTGPGVGTYARRFDATGAATGSEFRVNGTPAGHQRYPQVAMSAAGNFLVVWEDQDTDAGNIVGQFYANAASTSEAGKTFSFDVVLKSAPTSAVTIAVNSNNALEGSVSTTVLTFTAANWSVAQTVTVTGVDDTIVDGNRAYNIVLSAASSADLIYSGMNPADVVVTNIDNDTQSTIVVSTTDDTIGGDTSSLYALLANQGSDGKISLREAIMAANNTVNGPGGADRIEFNIADPLVAGAHLIELAVALPNITDAVIIDGSTEPDSVAGAPVIQIDGALVYNVDGLSLQAGSDGSTLRGLSVTGFFSNGTPAGHAITVASNNNVIAGNYVGLSPNGNAVGNWAGVVLVNSTNNLVGGLTPSERNVISANTLGAVGLFGASGNRVQGNYIGVAPNGISARPNYDGVRLLNGSSNNLIGGTAPGAGNLIAYSAGSGVMASSSTSLGNAVLGNRVFGSTGLGIDLGADGVSANDAGDADSGPNGLQNFPLLATANATSGNTTVVGSLNSNASSSYRIEFFSSSNGSLEGAYVYLGFTDVVTDSFGNANFSVVLSGVTVAANDMVISTATLKSGAAFIETSEFSEDVLATANSTPVIAAPGAQTTNEDTALAINGISVSDADGNLSTVQLSVTRGTLLVSLSGGASISAGANASASFTLSGSQAQINNALASVSYLGALNFNGADSLTLLATDALGYSSSSAVALTVTAVNDAPVITSHGGGASASVLVAETLTAVTTVTATDVDSTPLIYSISGLDAARFTIDASTGVLSFISAPDFEAPTDSDFNNIYDVTVQVSDGVSTDTLAFNITVTDVSGALVVTTTADTNDTGLGASFTAEQLNASKGADGAVSLREAIIAANNTPGMNVVSFNIAAPLVGGAHTISLSSALPNITDAVVIDASTEPDFLATGNKPVVVLNGLGAGNGVSGLNLDVGSSGSTVRGLVIDGFHSSGIKVLVGSNNNLIAGNYLGLDVTGSLARPNGRDGASPSIILLSDGNQVGGVTISERNVVSGNASTGVWINGSNNRVQGNFIGTDSTGTAALGNVWANVGLATSVSGNLIGGIAPGAGNVIANSSVNGVLVYSSTSVGNAVLGNRIYGNASLGIDLGFDGVSANDLGDADTGANDLQNFPVLQDANTVGGNTTVRGSLNSVASGDYRIEFFSAAVGNAAGHGEAQVFLGAVLVTTDSSGNVNFAAVLSGVSVTAGHAVTATATAVVSGGFGSTSEFAANVVATGYRPPNNTLPGAQTANEDVLLAITGLSVVDSDADLSTVQLTVTQGVVQVDLSGGANISAGTNASASFTLSGSQTQINSALASLTYQGALNFNGADTLTVLARDTQGYSSSAAVAITVSAVNDAPTTAAVTLAAIAEDSGAHLITQAQLLVNAADVDNSSLTASGLTIVSGNGVLVNNGNGTWTYTPALNDDSAVSFSYSISDNANNGSLTVVGTATLDITPVNDAPTTGPVTLTAISEDSGARLITQADLLVNATDVDSSNLVAQNLSITSGSGTLVNNANGTWTYTPALNDDSAVSFGYTVSDNASSASLSVNGTATLDITPVNDAPTTSPVTLTAVGEDSPGRLITQAQLLVNAADIDSTNLSALNLVLASGQGKLMSNGDGSWTYTPTLNDDSAVSFSFEVSDGNLTAVGTASLDITPVNDAPTTSTVTLAAISEDSGTRLITQAELLVNAADVDNANLVAQNLSIVSGSGQLVNNGNGTWSYTPVLNDDSAVSFGFAVNDGSLSVNGTASLDITPVNDAPVFNAMPSNISVPENALAVTTVSASDVDVPGQTLSYAISGGADAALFSVDARTGAVSFINAPDFEQATDADGNHIYELILQVSDGTSIAQQALRVTVLDVNEAPVLSSNVVAILSDLATPGTWVATASAVDPDAGDALQFALVSDANGRFVIDAASGRISVAAGAVFDVKVATGYDLLVRISDKSGLGFQHALRVNLDASVRDAGALLSAVSAVSAPQTPSFSFDASSVAAPGVGPVKPDLTATAAVNAKPLKLSGSDAPSAGGDASAGAGTDALLSTRAERAGGGSERASGSSASSNRVRGREDGTDATANLLPNQNASLLALMSFDVATPAAGTNNLSALAAAVNANNDGPAAANSLGYGLRRGMTVDADSDDAQLNGSGSTKGSRSSSLSLDEVFTPARVASVSFSAGFIWWLTRGGGLLTSMLMGVPAWRHVDLLPVLARDFDDDEEDGADDGLAPPLPQRPTANRVDDAKADDDVALSAPVSAAAADIQLEGLFEVGPELHSSHISPPNTR